jgi:hypothetical protein
MDTNATIRSGQHRSFWSWHGPDELILLIFLAAGFLIPYFLGKSQVAMASFVAFTICFNLAWQALHGDYLDKWTHSLAWRIRVAAAIVGGWMFLSAPTLVDRFTAVAVYAALYVLCEWTVWRRVRAKQSLAT